QVPTGLALARTEPLSLSVQIAALPVEQSLRLPVAVQNLAPGVVLGGALPVVDVTASGPADRGLGPADVTASVDASRLGAGTYALNVRVRLPDRYQLVSVQPPTATVVLDEIGAQAIAPTNAPTAEVAPPTAEVAPPTATIVPPTETAAPTPTA